MTPVCGICGEPMPTGEEMFKFHGYSGPCPKPPMSAPRPEGMSEEDLKRLAKVAKDADDAVSGPWSMDDHIVKPGDTPDQWHVYEQLEDDPPFATVDDPRLALHIATFDPPLCEALLAEVSRLRADGATLKVRADEALAAHSASFGALHTLSAALFDGEVDDYAALAEKVIARVRQLEADGATLRERVKKLPSPVTPIGAYLQDRRCEWCDARWPNKLNHPDNGCLWSDVHKSAEVSKEPTPHAVRETGWLIEHSQEGLLKYWSPSSTEHRTWVSDPWQAVRFSRREDAERVKVALNYAFSAVIEHAFIPKEPTPHE